MQLSRGGGKQGPRGSLRRMVRLAEQRGVSVVSGQSAGTAPCCLGQQLVQSLLAPGTSNQTTSGFLALSQNRTPGQASQYGAELELIKKRDGDFEHEG